MPMTELQPNPHRSATIKSQVRAPHPALAFTAFFIYFENTTFTNIRGSNLAFNTLLLYCLQFDKIHFDCTCW